MAASVTTDRLDDWVEHDLVTTDQAEAIRAYEAGRAPARRRLPLAAEALGYLGGALALIAAALIVAQRWDQLETWARLAIVAAAAGFLFVAGAAVQTSTEPALRRLTGFTWFLSSAAVAFAAGLTAGDVFDVPTRLITLYVGLATTVYASALWTVRRSVVQQIPVVAGLAATIVGLLFVPQPDADDLAGLAIWGLGVIWATLGWGDVIRPPAAAYAIGGVLVILGAQVLSSDAYRGWAIGLGLVSAAALLAASTAAGSSVLLAFGAAATFVFVPQAVFHWFGDTLGAPVALFVTGVAMLVLALVITRVRRAVT